MLKRAYFAVIDVFKIEFSFIAIFRELDFLKKAQNHFKN